MPGLSSEERARLRHRVMVRLYREWRRGLLTDAEYEQERKAAEEYL